MSPLNCQYPEKAELISKDEHVRVLSQQNQQMLELLENEEGKTKDTLSRIAEFKAENDNLSVLETEFEKIKKEIDALIKCKKNGCTDHILLNLIRLIQRKENQSLS